MYTLTADSFFFFFNDTATTEIYTLSLHDALPISLVADASHYEALRRQHISDLLARMPENVKRVKWPGERIREERQQRLRSLDRKSTRLNSSHVRISYAVFCLKKKK